MEPGVAVVGAGVRLGVYCRRSPAGACYHMLIFFIQDNLRILSVRVTPLKCGVGRAMMGRDVVGGA